MLLKIKNWSSYTPFNPFNTAGVVLKVPVTNSNSIPGTRTIIYLRNHLNESEGNPENSENEQNSNNDGEFQKLNEIFGHSEDVKNTEYRVDKVFQEKLMKPDSTQNSLKNFPDFSKCLRIFILYWINHKTSKKFLFVAREFDIFERYIDFFLTYIFLIPDEHKNKNRYKTYIAVGKFLAGLTMKMNIINRTGLNANDPGTSEVENLLSMGTAYIQLFVKAFFIVEFWERKLGTYLLSCLYGRTIYIN